jgi:alpha-N-arabinofuranosidase
MEYGVRATEGPHQYKVDGRYYLLTAEDMTWEKHMVVSYVADQPQGPYTLLPGNPALSHRDKPESPIQHTGHADLVQTQNGEWWTVLLGVRKLDGNYYLGRETFLAPAGWKDGNLLLGEPAGEVRLSHRRPELPWTPWPARPDVDSFDSGKLDLAWNFLRTPQEQWWSLQTRPGWLRIALRPEQTTQLTNPSLVARRFQHQQFTAAAEIDFEPRGKHDEAGLIAIQNDRFQYRLLVTKSQGRNVLRLIKVYNPDRKILTETVVAERSLGEDRFLVMELDGLELRFLTGPDMSRLSPLGEVQDASVLASNVSGGFIGAFIGMYASSNGQEGGNHADFAQFLYQPVDDDEKRRGPVGPLSKFVIGMTRAH